MSHKLLLAVCPLKTQGYSVQNAEQFPFSRNLYLISNMPFTGMGGPMGMPGQMGQMGQMGMMPGQMGMMGGRMPGQMGMMGGMGMPGQMGMMPGQMGGMQVTTFLPCHK